MSGVFAAIGREIGELVETKNAQYGDSFARSCAVLEALFPRGVKVEQYRTLLGIARIVDKLFRLATGKDELAGHPPCPHCGRSFESPGLDIAGYGILLEAAARASALTSEELAGKIGSGAGTP
jgi:hypothetical protein